MEEVRDLHGAIENRKEDIVTDGEEEKMVAASPDVSKDTSKDAKPKPDPTSLGKDDQKDKKDTISAEDFKKYQSGADKRESAQRKRAEEAERRATESDARLAKLEALVPELIADPDKKAEYLQKQQAAELEMYKSRERVRIERNKNADAFVEEGIPVDVFRDAVTSEDVGRAAFKYLKTQNVMLAEDAKVKEKEKKLAALAKDNGTEIHLGTGSAFAASTVDDYGAEFAKVKAMPAKTKREKAAKSKAYFELKRLQAGGKEKKRTPTV